MPLMPNEHKDTSCICGCDKTAATKGHNLCATCFWYVPDPTAPVDEMSVNESGELIEGKSRGIGTCHCSAPIFGDWAPVFADDFCGDWIKKSDA